MTFTLSDLQSLLDSNHTLFKNAILDYFEDYSVSSENNNIENILNLGYSSIIDLVKKINPFEPLPFTSDKDEICDRMVLFAKESMETLLDLDDYVIKLTDGDGADDSYYIVSFLDNETYLDQKYYIDQSLNKFKVYSDDNIIFELNEYPKASLNLTGTSFHTIGKNSLELLRGIFLSYYYFGNVEFKS